MAPVQMSIAECDRLLTAPGEILEMENVQIDGQTYRTWKNIPPTFRSFLLNCLELYSTRQFLSSPDDSANGREALTFGEVLEQSLRLAAWMRERGLGVGSRIAIGGANSTGWIVAFVATHFIGGVAVCLNAWLPKDVLIHCLTITKPEIVLLDTERAEVMGSSKPELTKLGVGEMFCWSSTAQLSKQAKSGVQSLKDSVHPSGTSLQRVRDGSDLAGLGPESDGVVFFSSGTSGPPKAVLCTQRMGVLGHYCGLVPGFRAAVRAGLPIPSLPGPTDPQQTLLLSIPLFHVTGCVAWLFRAFLAGSKLVFMRRWDTREAIRLFEKEHVDAIGGVPSVVSSILQSPHLKDTHNIAMVLYGGAPPSKELAREVMTRWPKAGILHGYGLTETTGYACGFAGADYVERPDSTGPPMPICDIRIVHLETRQPLDVGQTGLILIRGSQVMKCYLGNPAATAKAKDKDGWFDTGDIGYADSEGFIYIKDRLKDIIIRGGENITSADVENALYTDPRVLEAVAIGVPDRILGERVGAIVSIREGVGAVGEDELRDLIKPRLAYSAWPAIIFFHDGPLPRNANGKTVKKDLKPILVKAWEERQAKNPVRTKL